ncbi:MAG: pyridoxal phosphate-dependent aminotransferase family protein [Candidatus Lokiarchaeota archaeon]|nr:pyridoxal phosphate-dependent aminotransferase family protein [Candidatus Lokiarchaeota archaeon]
MNEIKRKFESFWKEGLPTLAKKLHYYPYFFKIEGEQNPRVVMDNRDVLMLGSNNYLGMTSHPDVKRKAMHAIEEYGVGTTGSRLLNGTMELHLELEKRLARFLGCEQSVVFSTGMQANLGAISSILTEEDEWVISDKANHASIIDGVKLGGISQKHKLIYEHCDMEDLEAKLKLIPKGRGIIITEGVFSMEGDVSPLDHIVDLAGDYDALIYLDDAHGLGVLGNHGRGTCHHLGCQKNIDMIMGTFSKSFASIGGFVAGSEEICNWIKHNARSFIFSASPPPSVCATVLAVLDIIESDDGYQKKLLSISERMRKGLSEAGFHIGCSQSAIIPIIIGNKLKMFEYFNKLFKETPTSVFTNPIRSPAVPIGREMLRTSCMATMNDELVDLALDIITKIGKDLNII